jgi:hypothetical protein
VSVAFVLTDPTVADAGDQVVNGVGNLTSQAYVGLNNGDLVSVDQKAFRTIKSLLLAGSLFTLLLAGVSMLVLALEHVRERRRPLAVLAAAGCRGACCRGRGCGRPRSRWRSPWSSRSAPASAWSR